MVTGDSLMYRFAFPLALALVSVLGFAGCTESGGPSVEYVEGVVTLDGQPIGGVTVSFSPVDPKTGTAAVGETDASGVFKLTAVQGGKPGGGTAAGEYQVAFSKVKVLGDGTPEVTSSQDPNYGKAPNPQPQAAKTEYVVPQKYENPMTSGFKVTVKPGTNKGEAFKFDLKKEG